MKSMPALPRAALITAGADKVLPCCQGCGCPSNFHHKLTLMPKTFRDGLQMVRFSIEGTSLQPDKQVEKCPCFSLLMTWACFGTLTLIHSSRGKLGFPQTPALLPTSPAHPMVPSACAEKAGEPTAMGSGKWSFLTSKEVIQSSNKTALLT